jgi:hypothetical protein
MKQQVIRRSNKIKPIVTAKTTAITMYNLRKRIGKQHRKFVTTTRTTVTFVELFLKQNFVITNYAIENCLVHIIPLNSITNV